MTGLLTLLVVLVSTSLLGASDGPTVKTRNGALAGSRGRAETVYWANFAKTGDPNGAGLPRWLASTPDSPQAFELGDRLIGE